MVHAYLLLQAGRQAGRQADKNALGGSWDGAECGFRMQQDDTQYA